jgi:O-methyltransferase involved in polyketide biosynthesis
LMRPVPGGDADAGGPRRRTKSERRIAAVLASIPAAREQLVAAIHEFGEDFELEKLLSILRVFEVDHPATQAWKQERAALLALPTSDGHVFAPIDFERQTLQDGLDSSEFDWFAPTLFSWLGVTAYLTTHAVEATLRAVAETAAGSEIVLSYATTEEFRDEIGDEFIATMKQVAADSGEPLVTFLSPTDAEELVGRCGLEVVDHPDRTALHDRYFADRDDGLTPYTAERVMTAVVTR